jgi:hypothetical protein
MFAMPQLRLIFLSLFISSISFSMEHVNNETYCESYSSDEEDIIANVSKKSLNQQTNKAIIRNVLVARQSGASCGYHSILNSVLSLPGMNKNEAGKIIKDKFSQKDGEWRAFIIKMRKEKLIKNYIKNFLHRYMPLNTNGQLRKLNDDERRALDRIANAYAQAFVLDETLNILKENPNNLENRLQEIIKRDQPKIEDKEIHAISQCIKMDRFH